MELELKIFFNPGDLCQLRLDIPNKPIMLVVKKESNIFKDRSDKDNSLKGIRCRWFNAIGELLEAIFNTKDLELL